MWRYNKFFEKLSSFAVYMFIVSLALLSVGTVTLSLKWVLGLLGVI